MEKKYTVLIVFVVGVLLAAFSMPEIKPRPTSTIYFLYSPTVYTETGFETAASWSLISAPTHPSCTGTINPCVVAINDADVPHISGNTPIQDFVAKLASITVGNPYISYTSAVGYCYGNRTDSKN